MIVIQDCKKSRSEFHKWHCVTQYGSLFSDQLFSKSISNGSQYSKKTTLCHKALLSRGRAVNIQIAFIARIICKNE